jgi:HAD superfamily hydrolase (TIGR01509 family)
VTPPAGVIFDLDGVLVDSGAHHRAAWVAVLDELGVTPARDFWRLTIGRPAEEAVALLLGRPLDPDEAQRLAYRKHQHYVRLGRGGLSPVPGAAEFVDALTSRGVPRAVATSASRRDVDRLLVALGLRAAFGTVVTADDVRWGKPDPEVYLKAAAGLRLPPARCLVFEDSVVGVQAARRAGMRVIGLTTAHAAAELCAAGAERAVSDFEGMPWPV